MVTSSTNAPPLLMTTDQAAARLGVSAIWLKREAAAGRVQYVQHGRHRKFSEADLQAFIESRTVKAVNRPA